jgi:hypothetical protein
VSAWQPAVSAGSKNYVLSAVFLNSSSCSDSAIQVGKRVNWLVCIVESKAYLRECDVEYVMDLH